jgi:hypothetical protein
MTATNKYGDNSVDADAVTTRAESKLSWWWFVGLLAIVILIWFAYYWFAPDLIDRMGNRDPNSVWTTRGQFGDMFGALNALFSAIAFAALVYTVFLQRTELELQRKELHDTREEIRGQKLQLEAQTKAFLTQNFESLFFQQLALHDKVVKRMTSRLIKRMNSSEFNDVLQFLSQEFIDLALASIRFHSPNLTQQSRRYLSWDEEVRYWLQHGVKRKDLEDSVSISWDSFVSIFERDLGQYFRSIELILEHIDAGTGQTKSLEIPKNRYADILISQLSSDDLVLLLYQALSPSGTRLKLLVERYGLLRYLEDARIFSSCPRKLLADSAFCDPIDA